MEQMEQIIPMMMAAFTLLWVSLMMGIYSTMVNFRKEKYFLSAMSLSLIVLEILFLIYAVTS